MKAGRDLFPAGLFLARSERHGEGRTITVQARISSSAYGREGEALVAALLESEGWTVLARNFRAGRGEIDLVVQRRDLAVFVEVKRWNSFGPRDLSSAISRRKMARIVETSKIFLSKYRQYNESRVRYDVFLLSPDGTPRRYEGAFDESV